ncbi:WD40 repeat-containing protein [Artemisia annua]|uniref:WD40 repeat-containing protein n=1 Tax=Artemisia annua TaxID=35608 RepID=A0A2U1N6U7_ARTAN|nr:WD40 repeat-containing protein [Artemisia annua]
MTPIRILMGEPPMLHLDGMVHVLYLLLHPSNSTGVIYLGKEATIKFHIPPTQEIELLMSNTVGNLGVKVFLGVNDGLLGLIFKVWKFLITFVNVLGIWPFAVNKFVETSMIIFIALGDILNLFTIDAYVVIVFSNTLLQSKSLGCLGIVIFKGVDMAIFKEDTKYYLGRAIKFARSEWLIPAPKPTHATAAPIREALHCKKSGESKPPQFSKLLLQFLSIQCQKFWREKICMFLILFVISNLIGYTNLTQQKPDQTALNRKGSDGSRIWTLDIANDGQSCFEHLLILFELVPLLNTVSFFYEAIVNYVNDNYSDAIGHITLQQRMNRKGSDGSRIWTSQILHDPFKTHVQIPLAIFHWQYSRYQSTTYGADLNGCGNVSNPNNIVGLSSMCYDYLRVLSDPSSDLDKILYMLASGVSLCGTYEFHNGMIKLMNWLPSILQEALRSSIEGSIVPAFATSCKAMFDQVDATFQKGLQQQVDPTHSPLADAINSASSMTRTLSSEVADGQRKLVAVAVAGAKSKTIGSLMTQLTSSMTRTLSSEVADGQRKLVAVAVAGAKSKTIGSLMTQLKIESPVDPKKELSRLVYENKYEEAFTSALQRSDVWIVSWLCSQVCSVTCFLKLICDTSRKLSRMMDKVVAIKPSDGMIAMHVSLPNTSVSDISSIRAPAVLFRAIVYGRSCHVSFVQTSAPPIRGSQHARSSNRRVMRGPPSDYRFFGNCNRVRLFKVMMYVVMLYLHGKQLFLTKPVSSICHHCKGTPKQRWSKDVSIYSDSSANVNGQCQIKYSTSINDIFAILAPPTKPNHAQEHGEREPILINHVCYIDSEQRKRVQLLVSENGFRRSKVVAD